MTAPAPGGALLPGATTAAAGEIIIDDKVPGGFTAEPAGAWEPSAQTADSFQDSSVFARVDGNVKKATFNADIPADGEYEVSLWFVVSNNQFRSAAVPVTIHTAAGPQTITVDQTNLASGKKWNTLGRFALKAGTKVPVVTVSTEGLAPGPTLSVSADAVRLVKV